MDSLSHHEPTNAGKLLTQPHVTYLAEAISDFISASSSLEQSYATLQAEVAQLSRKLAVRNSALKLSLAENQRVHRALKQMVDSMPCGVLVVEQDGAVSMMNPEGRRLLEVSETDGMNIGAISQESGIDLEGFLARVSCAEDEQEFSRSSGAGKRWLAVHDRRLFSEVGDERKTAVVDQTILILRDVTLHKQAELERERARKSIALSEVATTLAHEIRNPLASLELFAGLIAEGGEGRSEWISHLHAGIRSLAGTVNNVLSFHGVGFPELKRLSLDGSIRSSVEFVRPIAEQSGVELCFVAPLRPVFVMGNGSALQQVVLNLVSNAIRHTRESGVVRVTVRELCRASRQHGGRAVIEFADSGTGIAEEHLQEIFRPGFSGTGTTSGLGLAVCRQIMTQHDGTIEVVSKAEVGTTFFVEIPTV